MIDIGEIIVRGFVSAFFYAIRIVAWFAMELFFWPIIWYLGWPICRAVTFGHYPKMRINNRHNATGIDTVLVSVSSILMTSLLCRSNRVPISLLHYFRLLKLAFFFENQIPP